MAARSAAAAAGSRHHEHRAHSPLQSFTPPQSPKGTRTGRSTPSTQAKIPSENLSAFDRLRTEVCSKGLTNTPERSTSFIEARWFQITVYILIFLNAAQMGLSIDIQTPMWMQVWNVSEHVFTAAFLVEMLCKLYVLRFDYFKDNWNRLDGILVWMSIMDVWVLNAVIGETSLRNLSILRILRILRIIRMVRFLRAFKELWIIVCGILSSFRTMAWISLLLFLALYVCAILCVSTIGNERNYPGYDEDDLEDWYNVRNFNNFQFFGTIPRAMYTLFNIVIMAEWSEVGRALIEYQPFMFVFFLFFIIFMTFGLMNVIIGVIVDNTMATAKAVEWDHLSSEKEYKMLVLKRIQEILFDLDEDKNGCISVEELTKGMENPEVKELLSIVKLPVGMRPQELMDLLDGDADGRLNSDEFTMSVFRLVDCDEFQSQCLMLANTHRLQRNLGKLDRDLKKATQDLHADFDRIEVKFGMEFTPGVDEPKPSDSHVDGSVANLISNDKCPNVPIDDSGKLSFPSLDNSARLSHNGLNPRGFDDAFVGAVASKIEKELWENRVEPRLARLEKMIKRLKLASL